MSEFEDGRAYQTLFTELNRFFDCIKFAKDRDDTRKMFLPQIQRTYSGLQEILERAADVPEHERSQLDLLYRCCTDEKALTAYLATGPRRFGASGDASEPRDQKVRVLRQS